MAKQDKIDALRAKVTERRSLDEAVLELLKGIKTIAQDAREADDEAELDEILALLDGPAAKELAAAVAANTPTEPISDLTPEQLPVEDVQAAADEAAGNPSGAPGEGGQPA